MAKLTVYLKKWQVDNRVFRTVEDFDKDTEVSYRFDGEKWVELDRPIDYNSGFGDSDLWDEITQKEALELMGLEKWPEGQEPGEDEEEKTPIG